MRQDMSLAGSALACWHDGQRPCSIWGARRRLAEVQEAAGAQAGDAALARMLESGDFDAAEYDRAMDAAFGDDYYQVAGPGATPGLGPSSMQPRMY